MRNILKSVNKTLIVSIPSLRRRYKANMFFTMSLITEMTYNQSKSPWILYPTYNNTNRFLLLSGCRCGHIPEILPIIRCHFRCDMYIKTAESCSGCRKLSVIKRNLAALEYVQGNYLLMLFSTNTCICKRLISIFPNSLSNQLSAVIKILISIRIIVSLLGMVLTKNLKCDDSYIGKYRVNS